MNRECSNDGAARIHQPPKLSLMLFLLIKIATFCSSSLSVT
ncbi:hypothetical protein SLEP1_g22761 [Rubroshorea leprosula]|uniref:Uncharacterized protein n=1 Tax=Rubroshorea leprosula TaxID=152421 RepID=A0AAV5JGA6_9ROSI|nr:hypothetical protein SLEP1_g22761 [Rubroshorea leprosula]